ncbi:MAG TPA: VCBS repeat-containing protein, partial [Candidatus Polarisedimenticolia bacterium]|nr:VCBS repeat-containing protein [Candidatus Polarisedimenticolia bacterium]
TSILRDILMLGGDGERLVLRSTTAMPGTSNDCGVAVGRLDADAHLDLVVGASGAGLATFRGDGAGGFAFNGSVAAGSGLEYPMLGDFDEDGDADIVASNTSGVFFLRGHGDGSFEPEVQVAAISSNLRIAAARLDADAHLDLAVGAYQAGTVQVFAGTGVGTFAPGASVAVGSSPQVVAAGDFDGDGNNDLAALVTLSGPGNLAVMFGAADGSLTAPLTIPLDTSSSRMTTADFDLDGRDDIAVAYFVGHEAIFFGEPGRTFTQLRFAGATANGIASDNFEAADFNRDGRPDLISGSLTGVALLLNRGIPGSDSPIPPEAAITGAASFECDAPGTGTISLDGLASTGTDLVSYEWLLDTPSGLEPLGTGLTLSVALPLGPATIVLRVTNALGGSDDDVADVLVVDSIPPTFSAALAPGSPALLWPPNHRLVTIATQWNVSDVCDPAPAVALFAVTSDEPDDAPGGADGMTLVDIRDAETGTADASVQLRAERSSSGDGREYRLAYFASDASGNSAAADVVLSVPLHAFGEDDPLSLDVTPVGLGSGVVLSWTPVGSAYDVITGFLGGFTVVDSELRLGNVEVLAAGTNDTSVLDDPPRLQPASGQAVFYLVQYHDAFGPTGYGSEPVPWPRVPTACSGGCP